MTQILHISAECYPVAKVGGLADVVGALPKYQKSKDVNVAVVMPFYNNSFTEKNIFKTIFKGKTTIENTDYQFTIKQPIDFIDFDLFLIDLPELLFTDSVYEAKDETLKFLSFQITALEWIATLKVKPNLIHVHDHHTGLIPFMMTQCFKFENLKNIPTVFTIHNAQYQGWFKHERVNLLPAFEQKNIGLLDWNTEINPMAAAIKCAWSVTTVSPNYMLELQENANGLESLLNHEKNKCQGVMNGIDDEIWNPEKDSYLIENYKITNQTTGKKKNKQYLCKEFGFDDKKPLFIFIGRLVDDKGCDLFAPLFNKFLKDFEASFLFLGSGNESIQNELFKMNKQFKGKYYFENAYNEKLSRIMYAGADFLLMPSRIEPCGLNQLYALRYGTIPIVNSIGGLKDTVVDIDNKGFGFVMKEATIENLKININRAIKLFSDSEVLKKSRIQIMKIDHSWKQSAAAYQKIYNSLK